MCCRPLEAAKVSNEETNEGQTVPVAILLDCMMHEFKLLAHTNMLTVPDVLPVTCAEDRQCKRPRAAAGTGCSSRL